jgi:hypothetical protein
VSTFDTYMFMGIFCLWGLCISNCETPIAV